MTLIAVAQPASATVLFSNTANGLSASASFTISGSAGARQLAVLLTNTDAAANAGAPTLPSQALTGLFFNLGTSTFRPATGGGEFGGTAGGASWHSGTQDISSSGYLNDAATSNFNGQNWDDPVALNGINFGMVADGWSATPNGGLDSIPLIEGTVKFVLNVPEGLAERDIKNVYFAYGTSPNEGTVEGTTAGTGISSVPEPALLSMFGLALVGLGYRLRRRNKNL